MVLLLQTALFVQPAPAARLGALAVLPTTPRLTALPRVLPSGVSGAGLIDCYLTVQINLFGVIYRWDL